MSRSSATSVTVIATTALIRSPIWPAICRNGIRTSAVMQAGAPMENPRRYPRVESKSWPDVPAPIHAGIRFWKTKTNARKNMEIPSDEPTADE